MADNTVLETVPTRLLIGGAWVDATGGGTFEVHNPADAGVLTRAASRSGAPRSRALAARSCARPSSC